MMAITGVNVSVAEANACTFTTFDASSQLGGSIGMTYASGINDSGQVVGYVGSPNNTDGFIFGAGTFTQVDVPILNAFSTEVLGINNNGELVGIFSDDTGQHGFVATLNPAPEPTSLAVLGFGLAGLAGAYPRRRMTTRLTDR